MPFTTMVGGVPINFADDGTPQIGFEAPAPESSGTMGGLPTLDLGGAVDQAQAAAMQGQPMTPPEVPAVADTMGNMPAPGESVSKSTSTGSSVSVSETGVDEAKSKRLHAGAKAEAKGIRGQIMGEAAQDVALMDKAFAGEAAAESAVAQAEADKSLAQAQAYGELAKAKAEHAAKSQEAQVIAEQRANEAKAAYEQSVAEFRAMKVNPGQLFANMTNGEQFGTMIGAFVTDFLGSKGIKTSAMDIFNRAVEQNINAQVENIKNAGQATEMFKSLWEMTRAQSRDEAEAKDRIAGYMYASLEQKLLQETAKYNAPLALANGQKALAQVRTKQAEITHRITDAARRRASDEEQRRIDNKLKADQLAISSRSVAVAERNAETDARRVAAMEAAAGNKATGEAAKDLNERIVYDPTDVSKPVGAGRTKEQANKLREQLGGSAEALAAARELREIVNGKEFYMGPFNAAINPQDKNRAVAAYRRFIGAKLKARSGATVNEGEVERVMSETPLDTFLSNVDTFNTWNDEIIASAKAEDADIRAQVGELTETEQSLLDSGMVGGASDHRFGGGIREDAEINATAKPREHTSVDDAREKFRDPKPGGEARPEVVQDLKAIGIEPKGIAGFGKDKAVPEQYAALRDLANIATDPSATVDERDGARQALLLYSAGLDNDTAKLADYYYQQANNFQTSSESDPWRMAVGQDKRHYEN